MRRSSDLASLQRDFVHSAVYYKLLLVLAEKISFCNVASRIPENGANPLPPNKTGA